MEYLDVYDESKNYIGKFTRKEVHEKALWHNTVHCWLYDSAGSVYFQIRKDRGTFYTTASGHVLSGETIKQAFGREIKEEIGIEINYEDAVLVNVVPFVLDMEKSDGSIFRDRAFSNVYVYNYEGNYDDFDIDLNEITGLVKVNVKEALSLFKGETDVINGDFIINNNGKNECNVKEITKSLFLVNEGETLYEKYGPVLEKVLELISL